MNSMLAASRRGFSVIELFVVIGIIGLLLSLMLPAIQRVRESAARVGCSSNLHQIGLACHSFESSEGTLPPSAKHLDVGRGAVASRMALLQWPVLLLPYIEQGNLWQQTLEAYRIEWLYNFNDPPHVGLSTVVRLYTCPTDSRLRSPLSDDQGYRAAYWSYMGVSGGKGPDGVFYYGPKGVKLAEIRDGTSQTLLVGERTPPGRLHVGAWYSPVLADNSWIYDEYWHGRAASMTVYREASVSYCQGPFQFGPGREDNPCDSNHFWSYHPGGAHFVFADGHVQFLRYSAAPIMPALGSRAGGEVVELPD